ncbi:MAG: histidine phosphatase family protein [Myxococcota bacterium]|nr:histidine phosphatase family protein [Myxococcota bacterium]
MSRFLTVIRHAKSGAHETGTKDFDRPLDRRGREDAPEMGRRLARLTNPPSLLVSSPAKRAAETAEAIAGELIPAPEIAWERALYLADFDTLLETVFSIGPEHEHAALVGHNPGITDFVNRMANATIQNVPTCGTVRLEFAVEAWTAAAPNRGDVIEFDHPKRQRNGASND